MAKWIKCFLGLFVMDYLLLGLLYLLMGESMTSEIVDHIKKGHIDIPKAIALFLPAIVGSLLYDEKGKKPVKEAIGAACKTLGLVLLWIAAYVVYQEIKKEGILAGIIILLLLGVIGTPVGYVIIIIFDD